MDVSIIIVNYNTKELLMNCISSIYQFTQHINFEIIVSDNGSTDGSIEMLETNFPQVILIKNNVNLGFGAANNRALSYATGKYIFYLNSDTILLNNAIKIFYDYWETCPQKDTLGALGCNLLDQNMNLTHSYGNFPSYQNEVIERLKQIPKLFIKKIIFAVGQTYNKKNPPIEKQYLGRVDYVTGADLFLKNNSYAQFDERFFLYYEETDLQYKLKQDGFHSEIIAGPIIQHLTTALTTPKNDIQLFKSFSHIQSDISALKYFQKHTLHTCFLLKIIIKLTWFIIGVKNENSL